MRSTPNTRSRRPRPVLRRAALVSLLAAAGVACGGAEGGEEGPAEKAPVETAVVQDRDLAITVSSVGSLEADASAEVSSEYSGVVSEISFREGGEVEEGEVLVRLDDEKLSAALEAAQATLARARAEARNLERQVERNDKLLAQGAISEQAYDDLQTQYNSAQARLEEAQANVALARRNLRDATIRAPFDGRVGARTFDVGDYVNEGTPLFTVVDDDTLKVQFTVPEQYLGRLHRGSPVSVHVRSMPGRRVEGSVYFVSPTVDPVNRTVALKARVPNPEMELRAGQFADVRLVLEVRENTLVVPEAAVVPRRGTNFVFRVAGGTAHQSAVELGERQRGIVEVRSGVSAGDTVVVAGQQRLQDGTPVESRGRQPGTEPGDYGSDTGGASEAASGPAPSGRDTAADSRGTAGGED